MDHQKPATNYRADVSRASHDTLLQGVIRNRLAYGHGVVLRSGTLELQKDDLSSR